MSEKESAQSQRFENVAWAFRTGLFFIALTGFVTRDEFRFPATVGLTSTTVPTVPLFNAWTLGWNADRLKHGFTGYWNAPIFYPVKNVFAFSEPQPATLIVAPVVWATGSIIVGYKTYLFLSLFLNGFFAALLLRRMDHHWLIQLGGGAGVLLLPVIHQRLDVIQLVPVWGILWFWSSIFELLKRPSFVRSLTLGISYFTCFALCIHHALFVSLLMSLSGLVFLPAFRNWKFALLTMLSILIGLLLASPILMPIRDAAKDHDFSRNEKLVQKLSARPADYFNSPPNSIIKFDLFDGPKSRQFCVGWFRCSVACLGVIFGFVHHKRRRWVVFLIVTGLAAYFFSLGPNLQIGEWRPWESLCEHVPGVAQVRSVYRFVWFVQLAIVFLAIEGLAGFLDIVRNVKGNTKLKACLGLLVFSSGMVFVCEVLPQNARRVGVPILSTQSRWVEFVRENTPADKAIACLPFATGISILDYDVTTRWMCYGLQHHIPMVNGYSGFFPKEYLRIKKLMNLDGPSLKGLQELAQNDVHFLVVSRSYCKPSRLLTLNSKRLKLELVLEDNVGIDIYTLRAN